MPGFSQFIRERQYLANVTPATVRWYSQNLKWLPNESPTREQLKDVVIRMREKGRTAAGCNSAIRVLNAYLHWSAIPDGKCSPACQHPRIPKLKEPQLILPTFTGPQIKHLVSWKPKSRCQRRLHLLTLILLDTGARITEALTLCVHDVDLDNLLLKLDGKGRKERLVPISVELRKALVRYIRDYERKPDMLLLASRNETRLSHRNTLRAVKGLCKRLGIDPPRRLLHAFRHTFAVSYLRRGGSVFHLQKVLGHSSLEMTRRYANLVTADLQAVHERMSLLSR